MREASLVAALVVAAVYLAGCATTIEPNLHYSVQTRKSLQDTEARPAAPLAENSLDIFVYGVSTEVQVYQPKNFLGGGGLVATGQIINNDQFANTPITEFEAADFIRLREVPFGHPQYHDSRRSRTEPSGLSI